MLRNATRVLALAVAALPLAFVACDDDDGDPAGPTTVSLTATLVDFTADSAPVVGAELCLEGTYSGCVTTGADGTGTFTDVPAGSSLYATGSADTFLSIRSPLNVGDVDLEYTAATTPAAFTDVQALAIGTTYDDTLGALTITVRDSDAISGYTSVVGAVVTISPQAGEGPYYTDDAGIPSKTATETSSLGVATVLNVPDGDYDVTVTVPGSTCAPHATFGRAGSGAGTYEAKVNGPAAVYVVVTCGANS